MNLLISLQAERIKIKKSSIYYVCFIAAAVVPVILFFEILTPSDNATELPQGMSMVKYLKMAQQIFNFIFLPLFIILISTLMQQLEYRNNTWKQVLTSPQKLINIFLSKYFVLQLIIILFITAFLLLMLAGVLIIDLAQPQLLINDFSLQKLLFASWKSYVSILGLSALQFWLALRFKNFIVPLAIGFCLWIMAPLMLFSLHWSFADSYPYSFPILLAEMSDMGNIKPDVVLLQWLSLGYCVFFLIGGFWDFQRQKKS